MLTRQICDLFSYLIIYLVALKYPPQDGGYKAAGLWLLAPAESHAHQKFPQKEEGNQTHTEGKNEKIGHGPVNNLSKNICCWKEITKRESLRSQKCVCHLLYVQSAAKTMHYSFE